MINKILDELNKQYKIPEKILKSYVFEIKGNKIFIMTKQVKLFDKIKSMRKGLLFATKLGNNIKVSNTASQIFSKYANKYSAELNFENTPE